MKEHGLLFKAEMVQAILEDRKTQTRRLVKLRKDKEHPNWPIQPLDILPMKDGSGWVTLMQKNPSKGSVMGYPLEIGDQFWVRETWAHDDLNCTDINCGNINHIWYRASENKISADSFSGNAKWRPGIHMFRWASRIDLEIKKIRVERLQDITGEECQKEGINPEIQNKLLAFQLLWDSINPKLNWEFNPWVWVIDFERVKP